MVFDATSKVGQVHCRLAWSNVVDSTEWKWVDAGGLTGADFIPLGGEHDFDSHICFAAASPVDDAASGRDRFLLRLWLMTPESRRLPKDQASLWSSAALTNSKLSEIYPLP